MALKLTLLRSLRLSRALLQAGIHTEEDMERWCERLENKVVQGRMLIRDGRDADGRQMWRFVRVQ